MAPKEERLPEFMPKTTPPNILSLLTELAADTDKTTRKKNWLDIYGSGPKTRPLEVLLTKKLAEQHGFSTEVTHTNCHKAQLEKQTLLKIFAELEKRGWPKTGEIDAVIGGEKPIFLEFKISKLDKIHGQYGGLALHDIGEWSKDIDRLQCIKKNVKNARCFFVLVGVAKEKLEGPPFDLWINKLKRELKNDSNRAHPEMKDAQTKRIPQLKILKRLHKLKKHQMTILSGNKWALFSLEV